MRSQIATSNDGRGGRRYAPYVFTEQGVAMLSGVLRSDRAITVNIKIMRTFVELRRAASSYAAIESRLKIKNFRRDADGCLGFRPLNRSWRMKARTDISAADSRFRSKSASRAADSAALESGSKSPGEIKRENEVFAPLARSARVDPGASQRLA